MSRVTEPAPPGVSTRPVWTLWLLIGATVSLPYLLAALHPPAGRSFAGTFHWIDDFYNYVSFVQQAEDGRLLFQNKLLLEPHAGVLVNLEWSLVGALSRLCGRRPFLAYRLFALGAWTGLLFATDRALRRGGLPPTHRTRALWLVALGGGVGGLRFELTDLPAMRCADMSLGYFPFVEALGNPHWLAATWLALEALLAGSSTSPRAALALVGWGTALGLVRPYDLVSVVAALATWTLTSPRSEWRQRGFRLLGLLPVVAYNYWVFYRSGVFPTYATTAYGSPPAADLMWAFGPVVAIALLSRPSAALTAAPRDLRRLCWVWAATSLLILLAQPVTFALQFGMGAGLPLLILAALGLARFPREATTAAVLALGTSSIVAERNVLVQYPEQDWWVPAPRREAALALRAYCRPGDLALSPADIGLYVGGLTSCRSFLSHHWEPDHADRAAAVRAFYTDMAPRDRARILAAQRILHFVLPGDAGVTPDAWLPAGSPFQRVARVGRGAETISVYTHRIRASATAPARTSAGTESSSSP
jgi:hypothetical protein